MPNVYNLRLFYLFCGVFIITNAIFIYNEFYWFSLLPVALFVVGVAFFSLDKLILLTAFSTPLSIEAEIPDVGMVMSLPTEPLMFGVMGLFIFKLLYEERFDSQTLKHPVTIAIAVNLTWLAVCVIKSDMPGVSLKYFLVRSWFIISFFFLAGQLFRKNSLEITRFLWLFMISLCLVAVYSVVHLSLYNFDKHHAQWVMQPFFRDHTAYGAVLAMFFPIAIGFLSVKTGKTAKLFAGVFFIIITIGLIFSFTRAAWLSLVVALGVWLIFIFRINYKIVAFIFIALVGLFFYFQSDLIMMLEKNKQDASSDLAEHVESISNIATDASNLERLNRWNCALRMFSERPVFGWGPGTYQFLYAPYQKASEQTIISTNFGDAGNAHSEYLGPLAEAGVLGSLSFIVVVFLVIRTASVLYWKITDRNDRIILMSVLLGLITYLVHGIMNNFLDLDKASVPFWGFIAIIVALDIKYSKPTSPASRSALPKLSPQ